MPSGRESIGAELPPPTEGQEVSGDFAALGLTLRRHPLAILRPRLKALRLSTADEVANARHGQWIRAAGLVTCRQRPATASGVLFVTLEDETGYVNLVVWNDVVERNRRQILRARLLVACGQVQRQGLVVHVLASQFEDRSSLIGDLQAESHDFH